MHSVNVKVPDIVVKTCNKKRNNYHAQRECQTDLQHNQQRTIAKI